MLRKYIADPSHVLETPLVEPREDLSFEVQPIRILNHRENVLRNKVVSMAKVLWRSDRLEEMTWETEASIRKCYPYFFFDLVSKILKTKFL